MIAPRFRALALLVVAANCERSPNPSNSSKSSAGANATELEQRFHRGTVAYDGGRYEIARAVWDSVLIEARSVTDSALEASVLMQLAYTGRHLGELAIARARADSAFALQNALDLRRDVPQTLNVLGLIALDENRNADAAELFEQERATAMAIGDSATVAKALGNEGLAWQYQGDLRRARDAFRQFRRAGRALGKKLWEANALANEASVDIAEGDALAAIPRLDTARMLYRGAASGEVDGEDNALRQLSTAYELTGDYDRAFGALDTALASARSHDAVGDEIRARRLLGGLHLRIGDYRRALRYYTEADSLARATRVIDELPWTLYGAAQAQALSGNLPRALASAREAYRLHTASGEVVDQAEDALLLARLQDMQRHADSAVVWLRAADSLTRLVPTRVGRAQVAIAHARHADQLGDGRRTLDALATVDSSLRNVDFEVRWTAADLAARAYSRLRKFDSAAVQGRLAIDAIERVRGSLSLEPMRTLLANERVDVYGQQIVTLLRLGKDAEAFQVADRARSRGLLDRLADAGRGAGTAIPREVLESDTLLRRIDALVQRLRQTQPPGVPRRSLREDGEAGDLIRQLTAARTDYEALMMRVARSDAQSVHVLGVTHSSLPAVHGALAADEALVEYFAGSDRLVTFVVTRSRLRVAEAPLDERTLTLRIRLLHDLWSYPRADWRTGYPVAEALYRDLLAPVGRLLIASRREDGARINRLVLVPHGLLAQVPFAALVDSATRRFLVQDFTVSYIPSASALVAARRLPVHAPQSMAAYGFAPFPRELPASTRELDEIAENLPSVRSVSGERATEPAFRDALLSGAMIHVATHGVMNALNPMFSRLELARPDGGQADPGNDGRFEIRELLGLETRSPLVFLSGCETGAFDASLDTPVRGAGELALSQAFLSAGARNVISTLWRIDDAVAARVSGTFYHYLRTSDAVTALASSQRDLLRDTSLGNPYFWAGYVLSGDGMFSLDSQSARSPSVH